MYKLNIKPVKELPFDTVCITMSESEWSFILELLGKTSVNDRREAFLSLTSDDMACDYFAEELGSLYRREFA